MSIEPSLIVQSKYIEIEWSLEEEWEIKGLEEKEEQK